MSRISKDRTTYLGCDEKDIVDGCLFIPEGITRVERCCGLNSPLRKEIKSVILPKSLREIGDFAFWKTSISCLELSGKVEIGLGAFSNCEMLEDVVLGEKVAIRYNNNPFESSWRLKSITISPKNKQVFHKLKCYFFEGRPRRTWYFSRHRYPKFNTLKIGDKAFAFRRDSWAEEWRIDEDNNEAQVEAGEQLRQVWKDVLSEAEKFLETQDADEASL